ncbi:unnamed protein product [Auanema sp. JU1783]|nr:unnamed protein product [Auanema sp. JU1783]
MGSAFTDEISNKLKLAIKKKLEELDVPADKDLLQYIMLMIANKKDKTEMRENLLLFMGKITPKFVDWLFEVCEQLTSSSASSSSKVKAADELKKKDSSGPKDTVDTTDRKPRRDSDREKAKEREREREREKEREKEKEKEKEKEREREKDRKEKERKEEDRKRRERDREREKREEERRSREFARVRRRTRSRTVSEASYDSEEEGIKKVQSRVVVSRNMNGSPEAAKVSSQVIVKRKLRPIPDEKEAKSRSQLMFMKALSEASASAGYGSSGSAKPSSSSTSTSSKPKPQEVAKPALISRLTVPPGKSIVMDHEEENDPGLVIGQSSKKAGPRITVTLTGAKTHLPSLKAGSKRKLSHLSGRVEPRVIQRVHDENERVSPTYMKWDGKINVRDEDMSEEDDEDAIDAIVASTRTVMDDEDLPPIPHLSRGSNYLQKEHDGPKPPERCKFWPNCRQGDTCAFAHPSRTCSNFPNCTFGNRCLYIHPLCRFGLNCTKQGCIFTHGGKVTGLVPTMPQKKPTPLAASTPNESDDVGPTVPLSAEPPQLSSFTPCRFGAACTKLGCTFKHPQACRYGAACYNQGCYFYHPPSTGTNPTTTAPGAATTAKYKWKAETSTATQAV